MALTPEEENAVRDLLSGPPLTSEELTATRDLLNGSLNFASILTSVSAIKNHLLSQKELIDTLKEDINILQQCLTNKENGIYIRKKLSSLERSADYIRLSEEEKTALKQEISNPTKLPGDYGTTRLDNGPMPVDLTPEDIGE